MAIQIIVDTRRILTHITSGTWIVGKLKVYARDAASEFQAFCEVVTDLPVVTPVMTNLAQPFECVRR